MMLSVPPDVMLDGDTWNWGPVSVPLEADAGRIPYVTAATINRKIATADNQDLATFNLTKKPRASYMDSGAEIHRDELVIHILTAAPFLERQ